MFAGKKSAQIREILISESAWEEMTCLFAPSLMSGYGVLFHSEENVGGLGLKCQYLTARGVSTALYVHSDSGVIGVSSCPLLRKSTTVVDNG